ncbi:MAG: hypothetical protein WCK11_03480 [Candidatus Falkowbacteria bacterium]
MNSDDCNGLITPFASIVEARAWRQQVLTAFRLPSFELPTIKGRVIAVYGTFNGRAKISADYFFEALITGINIGRRARKNVEPEACVWLSIDQERFGPNYTVAGVELCLDEASGQVDAYIIVNTAHAIEENGPILGATSSRAAQSTATFEYHKAALWEITSI